MRGERLRAAWWLLATGFGADPWRAVLAVLPLGPVLMGLVAYAGKLLVDALVDDRAGGLALAGVVGGVAMALLFVLTYHQAMTAVLRLREATSLRLDRDLLSTAASVPTLEHLEGGEFADRLEVIRQGRISLTHVVGLSNQVVGAVGMFVVGVALLVSVDPVLAVLPLAALPAAWVYQWTQGRVGDAEQASAEDSRVALHLFGVGTGASEGKEVRVFGVQDAVRRRFAESAGLVERAMGRAEWWALGRRVAGWVVYAAGTLAALSLVARRAEDGAISPGEAFLAVVLTVQLTDLAATMANVAAMARRMLDLAAHYAWLADQAAAARPAGEGGAAPQRIEHGIRLSGVEFRYRRDGPPALAGVDLHLPAGTAVAVVGDNGAGKSTLVKLLMGLYRPTAGAIEVDGRPLSSVDAASWWARVSAVCQDFVRFELKLQESVGVGDVARVGDEAAVAGAVRRARGEAIVEALPAGLGTQLGGRFGGVDLSAGQWQRVALARCLMRDGPLLVVLDEPTVSLDAVTEREFFEQFVGDARATAEATGAIVVLVSHRYATVRDADLIVVLDQGRVAELGTHDELLRRGGRYAEAYRTQAEAYR